MYLDADTPPILGPLSHTVCNICHGEIVGWERAHLNGPVIHFDPGEMGEANAYLTWKGDGCLGVTAS